MLRITTQAFGSSTTLVGSVSAARVNTCRACVNCTTWVTDTCCGAAPPRPPAVPIEVAITTIGAAGGRAGAAPQPVSVTQVVQLTQARQVFTLAADTEPTNVVLDPNAWVVMRSTLEKR